MFKIYLRYIWAARWNWWDIDQIYFFSLDGDDIDDREKRGVLRSTFTTFLFLIAIMIKITVVNWSTWSSPTPACPGYEKLRRGPGESVLREAWGASRRSSAPDWWTGLWWPAAWIDQHINSEFMRQHPRSNNCPEHWSYLRLGVLMMNPWRW